MGSTTSQTRFNVGTRSTGSTTAVSGSGTSSMSLSWMCWKPRMLEPSKPMPSSNRPLVSSCTGIEKCCQVPIRSTNLRSTILRPCLWARSMTVWASALDSFFERTPWSIAIDGVPSMHAGIRNDSMLGRLRPGVIGPQPRLLERLFVRRALRARRTAAGRGSRGLWKPVDDQGVAAGRRIDGDGKDEVALREANDPGARRRLVFHPAKLGQLPLIERHNAVQV